MIETALKESCKAIGGTWDAVANKCKLTNLPQCMLVEGACGSIYTQQGTPYKVEVKLNEKTECTQNNNRNGFPCMGNKHFTRTYMCYTTNCSCDTGGVACYSRKAKICVDKSDKKMLEMKNCCRPN